MTAAVAVTDTRPERSSAARAAHREQARSHWTRIGGWTQAAVGAGSPANGPGLLTNLHPPITVTATTVFAGKPAPTHASGVRHRPS
ncbi:hypothetical protein DM819_29190 [Pseudomonas hunanensis]|uniref:Uncharacterized protein n=1 Tax=Pseudomonas hunanensis TaxID=1247546 RepID=A0ABD6NC77_9PSED|nr:hypothetical protein [Pseudomonas hunanensis]